MADDDITLVRIYLKEGDQGERKRLIEELYELLQRQGLHGVTVFRGMMGFGPHGSAEADILHFVGNLPIVIEFFAPPGDATVAISALRLHKNDLNIVYWSGTRCP